MQRREILTLFGALAAAPLLGSLSPEKRLTLGGDLHSRLASGAVGRALTAGQLALVSALADTILPRTDTPGALDVQVPAFVDLLVAEWYPEQEKRELLEGLDALDVRCREAHGRPFAELDGTGRTAFLTTIDGKTGAAGSPEAAYRRLKDAIVYGYLTSEPVMEMMRTTPIIPGRFDGCVPVGGSR